MALEPYKTLNKSVINSSKGSNAWYTAVKGVIKSTENASMYAKLKNAATITTTEIAYADAGGAAMGFGSHYNPRGNKIHVNSTVTSDSYTFSMGDKVYYDASFPEGMRTPIQQLSAACDSIIYSRAIDLWANILATYPYMANTLYDHEFCAMLDMAYNMKAGAGWIKSNDYSLLRAAIANHQSLRKAGKAETSTEMLNARQVVVKTFLRYCNPGTIYENGLIQRRKKDAEMYTGSTTYDYDAAPSKSNTIAKDYGLATADLITVDLATDSSARTQAIIEAAESLSGTTLGDQIMQAASDGNYDEVQRLLAKITQGDLYKQKNQKTSTAVTTGLSDATKVYADIDELYITDSKAFDGLMRTERDFSGSYSLQNPKYKDFETARYAHNMGTAYGSFRKFKQTTEEDVSGVSTTWMFMTRPEMCLYQNASGDESSAKNWTTPSYQCKDIDLIDHLKIDRDLYIFLDRHIKPYYTDTNIAFIPSFTNNFKQTALPETKFDTNNSAANTLGVSLGIPVYNSNDTASAEIPVTFNPDLRKSIISYVDLIFKYSKSKKEGLTIPYPKIDKYNVIDISTTLFFMTVGPDGETLEAWYRSVGVTPTSNPITSVPLTSAGERMDSIQVSFRCNTNLDAKKITVIEHFNALNRMGCSAVKSVKVNEVSKKFSDLTVSAINNYDEAIDWYLINRHVMDVWLDDNMRPEDWHCERFVVYLDPSQSRANYKMVGIPKAARLYEMIAFATSSGMANWKNMSGRTTAVASEKNKTRFRPRVNAEYYMYRLNETAIKSYLAKADKRNGGSVDTNSIGNLNWAMVRMMDDLTKTIINDAMTEDNYHTSIVSGERSFGNDVDSTTVIEKHSALYYMNLFRPVSLDLQKKSTAWRPPLTTLFTTMDGKKPDTSSKGLNALGSILTSNSKSASNRGMRSLATFAAVHGGIVNYNAFVDGGEASLSASYHNYIEEITNGTFQYVSLLNRDVKSTERWKWESFSVNDASAGVTSTPASEAYALYKRLVAYNSVKLVNPLSSSIIKNGLFVIPESETLTEIDNIDSTLRGVMTPEALSNFKMNYAMTLDYKGDVIKSDDYRKLLIKDNITDHAKHTFNTISEFYSSSSTKDAIIYGIDGNDGIRDIMTSYASVSTLNDPDELVRLYWRHVNILMNPNASESDKKSYYEHSPADMVFEMMYEKQTDYYNNTHIPGRHNPHTVYADGKLTVRRSKAYIRYADKVTRSIIGGKTMTHMLFKTGSTLLPEKVQSVGLSTVAPTYDLEEQSSINVNGYDLHSVMGKSILSPSITYGNYRSFYLTPTTGGDVVTGIQMYDNRFGENRLISLNAFDGIYRTERIAPTASGYVQYEASGMLTRGKADVATWTQATIDKTNTSDIDFYGEFLPDNYDGYDMINDDAYRQAYYTRFVDLKIPVDPKENTESYLHHLGSVVRERLTQKLAYIALEKVWDVVNKKLVTRFKNNVYKYGDGETTIQYPEVTVSYSYADTMSVIDVESPSSETETTMQVDDVSAIKEPTLKLVANDVQPVSETNELYEAEEFYGTSTEVSVVTIDEVKSTVEDGVIIPLTDFEPTPTDISNVTIADQPVISEIPVIESIDEVLNPVDGSEVLNVEDVTSSYKEPSILDVDTVDTSIIQEETLMDIDTVSATNTDTNSIVVEDVKGVLEDTNVYTAPEVKGQREYLSTLTSTEVKATTDSQETTIEIEESTYSFKQLGEDVAVIEEVQPVSETTMSIADILNIRIDINDTPFSAVNRSAESITIANRAIESGNFDFNALINYIVNIDTSEV